jgi:CubicO group peptidase (beta-lactamase class C family)
MLGLAHAAGFPTILQELTRARAGTAEVPFAEAAAGRSAQSHGGAAGAAVVGIMTMSALAPPTAFAVARRDTVQQGLNALVHTDGMPAAMAGVKDREGRTRTYTAGVGDPATGSTVPKDGQVRIGSNTKVFKAVVVLQLVGEGKIGLDAPVDTYLPGLVRRFGRSDSAARCRKAVVVRLPGITGQPSAWPFLRRGQLACEPCCASLFRPGQISAARTSASASSSVLATFS